MLFAELKKALLACDDDSSQKLASGSRFIRHLPDQGSLAFLHRLYAPAADETRHRIGIALGRSPPTQVADFLAWSNGARLFDCALAIYGYSENLFRSLDLQDETAISLLWENKTFTAMAPRRWEAGWMRIGSVVGWSTRLALEAQNLSALTAQAC